MAELEEWIAFFEEKSCEEWVGVAHIRIDLQEAYEGGYWSSDGFWGEGGDVAQGVGSGRGVEEVQETSGGSGALDGGKFSGGYEGNDGGGWRISGRGGKGAIGKRGAGAACEAGADHRNGAFGNVWGDRVLGGVAAMSPYMEAGSLRMN